MQETNSDFLVQRPPPLPPTEMSLQIPAAALEPCTENTEISAVQLVNSLAFLIPYGNQIPVGKEGLPQWDS